MAHAAVGVFALATFKVGASRSLPLDTGRSWDGGAAQRRVWDWAGWDGNSAPSADGGKTRQAFLVYDADAADSKGAYKLPFADVVNGKLTAVLAGVNAAASRLPQTAGLSDAVKASARSVIEAYQAKADNQKSTPLDGGFSYDLKVRARGMPPTDALMEMARAAALDPEVFNAAPPFFARATVSTDNLDAYGTRMHKSTLGNFADDAINGVGVLNSHRTFELPVGRSINAEFTNRSGASPARTEADFYLIPGLHNGAMSSDDAIKGLRAGIYRDVSVGFYGGEMRCSICGRDIFKDFDCRHIPGWSYPRDNADEADTAEGVYHDGHLAEFSLVYDGATPGAMVGKVARMIEDGLIRRESTVRLLEARYRVKLPGLRGPVVPGWSDDEPTNLEAKEAQMDPLDQNRARDPDPDPRPDPADPRPTSPAIGPELIRSVYAEAGLRIETSETPLVEEALRQLAAECKRLRPQADLGVKYRSDLIEQALAEGVRAHGADFARETYEGLLNGTQDVEAIKRMRDDWAKTAQATVPNGRATTEGRPDAGEFVAVPYTAFRG